MIFKIKQTILSLSSMHSIAIGYFISRLLQDGSLVMLDGEVAAGKTTLVKGIAEGLKVNQAEYVDSPTYTLINKYYGFLTLYHIDLYRLNGSDDLYNIGLQEIFDSGGISVVEWAKKLLEKDKFSSFLCINLFRLTNLNRLIDIN